MTDHVLSARSELRASRVDWQRLRRILFNCALVAVAVSGTGLYLNGGAGLILHAEGFVTRDYVTVAAPFEARVVEVFVRPGDRVEAGQKIAGIESAVISRTLSDLSGEKARLISRIAQLEARGRVITETLPMAEASARRTATYLHDLTQASVSGLAVNRSVQEMTSASLSAIERVATLRAEQDSLSAELKAHRVALNEAIGAYDRLNAIYADGVLYATANGDIGSKVAAVGQVLASGSSGVANIYKGESFVLAYVPDSYLFDIAEGEVVGVKARNTWLNARIDRVLPMTEALPNDFQNPNRVRDRGRLVRIVLTDPNQLSLDQKIQVTSCYTADCRVSLLQVAWEQGRNMISFLPTAGMTVSDCLVKALTVVVERSKRAFSVLSEQAPPLG
jgi:multidrug efflux pump subunit AcrA (membrane-fusion protein)